jgi:hypothetical protein
MNAASSKVIALRSVAAGYRHFEKFVTPQPSVSIAGRDIKWYDIAGKDTPISSQVRTMAIKFLEDEAEYGELDHLGDLGFAILHKCGSDFYFLLLNSWRNENELWETTYAKRCADEEYFALFPRSGSHKPAFCVWEMDAVMHEQKAWRRFLYSSRDVAAGRIYLSDQYSGEC